MNIDALTIGEAKELAALFTTNNSSRECHPLHGQRVVAVLPHGFIHFGTLKDINGRYALEDASNLRYWKQRNGGLPEFARSGPMDGDRIDIIGTVYIESVIYFYPIGDWHE